MRQPQARASLRQALAALRKALAACDALRADGDTVALDPAAVSVDTQAFEQHVKAASPSTLAQAAALYHGDLLAGLTSQSHLRGMAARRARALARARHGDLSLGRPARGGRAPRR